MNNQRVFWSHEKEKSWVSLKKNIIKERGNKCERCGSVGKLDLDHKIPRKDISSDDRCNLQLLCVPCHKTKTRIDVYGKTQYRKDLSWLVRKGILKPDQEICDELRWKKRPSDYDNTKRYWLEGIFKKHGDVLFRGLYDSDEL